MLIFVSPGMYATFGRRSFSQRTAGNRRILQNPFFPFSLSLVIPPYLPERGSAKGGWNLRGGENKSWDPSPKLFSDPPTYHAFPPPFVQTLSFLSLRGTEGRHKVHGSVDPMFTAGLHFPVPEILEFKAFRNSGKFFQRFSRNFPRTFLQNSRTDPRNSHSLLEFCDLSKLKLPLLRGHLSYLSELARQRKTLITNACWEGLQGCLSWYLGGRACSAIRLDNQLSRWCLSEPWLHDPLWSARLRSWRSASWSDRHARVTARPPPPPPHIQGESMNKHLEKKEPQMLSPRSCRADLGWISHLGPAKFDKIACEFLSEFWWQISADFSALFSQDFWPPPKNSRSELSAFLSNFTFSNPKIVHGDFLLTGETNKCFKTRQKNSAVWGHICVHILPCMWEISEILEILDSPQNAENQGELW